MYNFIEEYKNIVEKIKDHLISELKKRYDDIEFGDDNKNLLMFTTSNYLFELTLENKLIYLSYYTIGNNYVNDYTALETFEDLFKYIDDVINREAE